MYICIYYAGRKDGDIQQMTDRLVDLVKSSSSQLRLFDLELVPPHGRDHRPIKSQGGDTPVDF